MPTTLMNQSLNDLQPHLNSIRQFALKAWDAYHQELSLRALTVFGSRSRASGVHDFMVDYASEFVAENDGMRMFKRRQMRGIVIGEKYAIRLKKLDEDNKSRNQPSKQVQAFREQQSLVGIGAIHNLEVGYILDALQREVIDVRLVCPSGDGTLWAVSLLQDETKTNVSDIFDGQDSDVVPAEIGPKESADILPFGKKESR